MGKDKRMLIKFENKSNRVKGLAFHPRRPWILASLHNGVIQLWDYRMGVLVDKFSEHDGPVRGVDFHNTQPLFVSGGDDYKIKVWNYQLKRCMFNLTGHLDYIRTVQFHKELPWIVSASDDQTIRVWNWQSRKCLSILTGHNHYVMCAQFHHKEDMIVSASLDQTVRVWDSSELRKKNSSVSGGDYAGAGASLPGNDLFGGTDVIVKHVLEGHTRGVNWASFHPTSSLIVSGADDRQVKLWRYNETKVWEMDTMGGHINNVSCVLFHPKKELIISNSEDKSIRVWDTSKSMSPQVLRRENDRYWILDVHPHLDLLAAGHDSGMMVFKLNRERPPSCGFGKNLYYYQNQYVYEYNFKTGQERPILSTRRRGNTHSYRMPRTLHYNHKNHSQHCILLTNDGDLSYELHIINKNNNSSNNRKGNGFGFGGNNNNNNNNDDSVVECTSLRGMGRCAVFVSRSRFAVLDKSRQIWLKTLRNETKKKITIPNVSYVNYIFYGGLGRLLLRTNDSMILYDIQALKVINVMPVQSRYPIKYVVWSRDMKYVAMFSKAHIYVANARLQELCTISENARIKSGAWDSHNNNEVFVYTTSNHIKYVITNGDSGIIRTLNDPIYIVNIAQGCITYLDRECKTGKMEIDCTEYQFKIALMKRKHKDVLQIMASRKLVGQAIISYLQEKGEPEVALHFVEDDASKFRLALECGNINVALECAARIDKNECWHRLGVEALRQGNHQVVEAAYQKTKNFERLSFLYLITGNTEKLGKMLHIAKLMGDVMGRFHNALYLGNASERVNILKDAGHLGLALVTAKSHGLEEQAAELLELMGDDVPDMPDLSNATLMYPSTPILKEANWPLLEIKTGLFNSKENTEEDEKADPFGEEPENDLDSDDGGDGGWGDTADLSALGIDDEKVNTAAADEGGWGDLGLDLPDFGGDEDGDNNAGDDGDAANGAGDDGDNFVMPLSGKGKSEEWSQNCSLVGDMVAAGSFDMAMHMLHRQIGVVNFAPLQQHFLNISTSVYSAVPQLPDTDSLLTTMGRAGGMPRLSVHLATLREQVKQAYKCVLDAKFQRALDLFRSILQAIPVLVLERKQDVDDVHVLVDICREYITAMRVEMARKDASSDPARQAGLSAYFTHCKIQPIHLLLGLRVAIKCSYTIKNFKTTAHLCRRVLELCVSSPNKAQLTKAVNMKQIRGVLKLCEKTNQDKQEVNYDVDSDGTSSFKLCSSSLTPIRKSDGLAPPCCPYCRSYYKPEFAGQTCSTCDLSKIGAETSGLKLFEE